MSQQGENTNNHNWKCNKNKYGKTDVICCVGGFDGGICGAAAAVWDRNYGIGLVGGYGDVGGRVCVLHQNILKLMVCLDFSLL